MKKGFTLIELLAVIVILAIIAVIAVPIVLNIIDEAKQSSTLRSADFYLDAVEMSIARATLKNQSIKDGTYNTKDGNICLNEACTEILEVEVNGEVPEIGSITISGGKIVSTQLISNNNMIVKNDKGELIQATLANTILKGYGGIGNINEIDKEYKENEWSQETDYFLNVSTSYKFGTGYEFDKTTGNFILAGTITEATVEECRNGTKQCGEYCFISSVPRKLWKINSFTNSDKSDTQYGAYIKGMAKSSYNGFSSDKLVGLYKTEDDLGTSYYYRGDIDNNYVRFKGTKEEEGYGLFFNPEKWFSTIFETLGECEQEADNNNSSYGETLFSCKSFDSDSMYWRIVRINGDGTIRLAYIGTGIDKAADGKIKFVGKSPYNPAENEQKYVKYTYFDGEKEVDSTVKSYIENWYKENMENKYSKYLSDGIYCNNFEELDLSEFENVNVGEYEKFITKYYKGTGYSLKCLNEESKYTMDKNIGNGKLNSPIGLITAEEVNLNGNWFSSSQGYDDNMPIAGWTMTPGVVDNYDYVINNNGMGIGKYQVWLNIIDGDGVSIHNTSAPYLLSYEFGVTPVINLKSDVKFKGNGTIDDPYEIITE